MTRNELLKWAKAHSYPAIQFVGIQPVKFYPVQGLPTVTQPMKYAIGVEGCRDNKMFWSAAIGMGNVDMINSLVAYIEACEGEKASC
jgi:hypothetical protein